MRLFVQNFKPDQSSKLYRLPLKFRRKTAQPNCKGLMHRFLNLSSLQVGIISLIGFLTTLLKTNPEASCIDCSIRAAFRMVSVSLWVLLQNCSNPVQRLNTQVIESEQLSKVHYLPYRFSYKTSQIQLGGSCVEGLQHTLSKFCH